MPDWNDPNSSSYKIGNYRLPLPPTAADYDKKIRDYYNNFAKWDKVDKNGNAIPELLGTRPVYGATVGQTHGFLRTIKNDPFHVEFSASNDPHDDSGFHPIPIFPGADSYPAKVARLNSETNPAEGGAHETGWSLDSPSSIDNAISNLENGKATREQGNRDIATGIENSWRSHKVRDLLYKSIETRLQTLGLGKFRAENDALAQGKYLAGAKPDADDRLFYGIVNDMIRLNGMGGYTGQGIKGTTFLDQVGNLIPGVGAGAGAGELISGGHFNVSLDPKTVLQAMNSLGINATATADNIDRNRKLDLQNEGVAAENATRSNTIQVNPDVQREMRQTLSEELDNNKNGNPLPKGTDVLGKDAQGKDNVGGFLDTMEQAQKNKAATGDINKPGQVVVPPAQVKLNPRTNTMTDAKGNPVTYDSDKKVWLSGAPNQQPPAEKGGQPPAKPAAEPTPAQKTDQKPAQPAVSPAAAATAAAYTGTTGAPTSDWNKPFPGPAPIVNAPIGSAVSAANPPGRTTEPIGSTVDTTQKPPVDTTPKPTETAAPTPKRTPATSRQPSADLGQTVENIKEGLINTGEAALRTPIAKFLNTPLPYPPGIDLGVDLMNKLFTPQNVNAPAYTAPPPGSAGGGAMPSQEREQKREPESVLEKALKKPPAPIYPETPVGETPPKKPAFHPWGILQPLFGPDTSENQPPSDQNQLPENAEMGAPLGSPDNPIVRQEHVDAMRPGTPFYWQDHPSPYVKV